MGDVDVRAIRLALLETFDSYHSNIRDQGALVEKLMAAVQLVERRRCAAVAASAEAAASTADGRAVAQAIAHAVDAG